MKKNITKKSLLISILLAASAFAQAETLSSTCPPIDELHEIGDGIFAALADGILWRGSADAGAVTSFRGAEAGNVTLNYCAYNTVVGFALHMVPSANMIVNLGNGWNPSESGISSRCDEVDPANCTFSVQRNF